MQGFPVLAVVTECPFVAKWLSGVILILYLHSILVYNFLMDFTSVKFQNTHIQTQSKSETTSKDHETILAKVKKIPLKKKH